MGKVGIGILSSVVLQAALVFPALALGVPQAPAGNQQPAAKPPDSAAKLQTIANNATTNLPATNASDAKAEANAPPEPESDATREDLANFDRFLDSHPILERELGSNPSLVNDPTYVQREPDLRIFLSHHPAVKATLEKNPQYLARRMDFAEANSGAHGSQPAQSLDLAEAGDLREFLSAHTDVKQLLAQNPALIDDSTFLSSHAAFKTFLGEHPRAGAVFAENPRYFISPAKKRAAAPPAAKPAAVAPVPVDPNQPQFEFGVTAENVGRMDQFLEDHPQIAKDLSKNPLLVTNHSYLDHHHELRRFFDKNVRIRDAFAEDPHYFVAGDTFDARPPSMEITSEAALRDSDLADAAGFLAKHQEIAGALRKRPVLAEDQRFLNKHDELRKFFDQNPHIQAEFDEHPAYFMRREQPFLEKALVKGKKKKR